MIFQVDKNILLTTLQRVNCAVTTTKKENNLFNATIFRRFIFYVNCDKLTIKASNLDVFISDCIDIENRETKKKAFAVEARQFMRVIRTLEQQKLKVEILDYQVIISHSTGSFAFPITTDVSVFEEQPRPQITQESAHSIRIEAPGLRSILNRCSFAVATDEFRPAMNGVCIRFTKKSTEFAASDGHRLIRIKKRPTLECEERIDIIIPWQVVSILRAITPKTGFADITFNEYVDEQADADKKIPAPACLISINNVRILFRPINARYPNYSSVIPNEFNHEFSANRLLLIKSINRLTEFTSTAQSVSFTLENNLLIIDASESDLMRASEKVPCEYSSRRFRIGFKDIYLLDILKNLSTTNVSFRMIDTMRACVILPKPQPDNDEEILMLIMPMILKD